MKTLIRKIAVLFVVGILASSQSAAVHAQYTPSGLLLGIYGQNTQAGLRVQGLIPGYSAGKYLQKGDILKRVSNGTREFQVRTIGSMERIKSEVGAMVPCALEIYRPGEGFRYYMISFSPRNFYNESGVARAVTHDTPLEAHFSDDPSQAEEMFRNQRSGRSDAESYFR